MSNPNAGSVVAKNGRTIETKEGTNLTVGMFFDSPGAETGYAFLFFRAVRDREFLKHNELDVQLISPSVKITLVTNE